MPVRTPSIIGTIVTQTVEARRFERIDMDFFDDFVGWALSEHWNTSPSPGGGAGLVTSPDIGLGGLFELVTSGVSGDIGVTGFTSKLNFQSSALSIVEMGVYLRNRTQVQAAFGLASSQLSLLSDYINATTDEVAVFLYNRGATAGPFQVRTSDGVAGSTINTGITPSVDTLYRLRLELSTTQTVWKILDGDGKLLASAIKATNPVPGDVGLIIIFALSNTEDAAKTLWVDYVYGTLKRQFPS